MSVWWPGVSTEIQEFVEKCPICARHQAQGAEPLITTPIPQLPWQKLAADVFELNGQLYLLVVYYYSKYVEVAYMSTMSCRQTINHFRSIFARHGIPEELTTDNGPQFTAEEFANFAAEARFQHITSSPRYTQANGLAERTVKCLKPLFSTSKDPWSALLAYRSTPLESGFSPAELLFNRKIQSTVPVTRESRRPRIPNSNCFRERVTNIQLRQEKHLMSDIKAQVNRF